SGVRWWAVIRRSPRRTCGAKRGGPKTVAGQPTGNPEPSTHTQPATMPIGDRVGDFDLAAGRAVTRPLVGRAERQQQDDYRGAVAAGVAHRLGGDRPGEDGPVHLLTVAERDQQRVVIAARPPR